MSNRTKDSKRLINIALFQLIYKKPYNEINVKDICDKANVSRMSFYRHYSSKDDVFISFCDEKFAEFYESLRRVDQPTPYQFIRAIIEYIYIYRRQITVLDKIGRLDLLIPQFQSYNAYLLKKINTPGFEKLKNNPMNVPFFAGGMYNVMVTWCQHEFMESIDTITDYVTEILTFYAESENYRSSSN